MRQFQVLIFLLIATLFCIVRAQADPITMFVGSDDGAAVSGPFPNSVLAQTSFLGAAGALGGLNTITFEGLPTGFNTSFSAAPGVSVTVSGPNDGSGYSGISNTTVGNLYGFNTTPGGSQWFGFPNGSATFTFATPTQSFGFWLTGVQTSFTTSITVSFNDGTSQVLDAPINTSGGASFFGFTDPGAPTTSITISETSPIGYYDYWGIDDVTYNSAPAPVPEPSSLLLLGSGIVGLIAFARYRLRETA